MNFYAVIRRGAIFFMEETGLLKTDLGECNLNVTHPNGGECLQILVSLIPDPKGNL